MAVRRHLRPIIAVPLSIAIAGGAGLADDRPLDPELAEILGKTGPPPAVSHSLTIDASGASRLVVGEKCEREGERELDGLTRSAVLEEAFAYLPEGCLWIDVGTDQTSTSVRVERELLDRLVGRYHRLILYHIHLERPEPQVSYFPAYEDLLATVLLNGRYLRDPEIEIRHRAVTPLEIFEYTFEPGDEGRQMLEVIFGTGLGYFAGENLLIVYRGRAHENAYIRAIQDCTRIMGPSGRYDDCFPIKSGDFVLRHRPR